MTRALDTHHPPPSSMPLDYRVFCQQRQHHYQRYATLLIHQPDQAHDTVVRALYDIALNWQGVLGAPSPAAAAWDTVKHHVRTTAAQQDRAATPPERREAESAVHYLTGSLPEDQRDIILLTWGLELTEEQISALTGLDTATVTSCRLLTPRTRPARPQQRRDPRPRSAPSADLPLDFEAFFTSWQEAFLGYVLVTLPDRTRAEELVLDAAAQMHSDWAAVVADLEPTAAAFRILRRTVKTHSATSTAEPDRDPLHACLRSLEESSSVGADCVKLRHLAGLSYPQVASLLGISQAAARTQTWTALRHLQDLLDRTAHQPGSETDEP